MSYFKLKFIQRVKKGKKNLKHVRFGLKIFATRQFLKWNFYIALQFELKFYNVSDFTLKILATCQNIKRKFHNTLDVDLKFLERVRFWKKKFQKVRFGRKMHSKYHVLALFTPWNWHFLQFLFFSEKHDFILKNLQGVRLRIENVSKAQILTQKFYNALDFDSKFFQCVRFGIKCFSTCRIREKKFKFKKSCFGYFYSVKTTYFAILFFFETQYFGAKFTQLFRFWIEKEYNAWKFKLIFLQCVRFWHRA